MRISDWSSDVCSSDLRSGGLALLDLEFVVDADRAVRNFAQLCGNAGSRLGLRVTPGSAKLAKQLLSAAGERTLRSEEHTSELQSLMRISYAVFCLKKKTAYNTYLTKTRP